MIIANEAGQVNPLKATSETTLDVSAKCSDICAVQNDKQTHSLLTTCCCFPLCFSISSGRSWLQRAQTLRALQESNWCWPELPSRLQVRTQWEPQLRTQNTSAPCLLKTDVIDLNVHATVAFSKANSFAASVQIIICFALAANADVRSLDVHNQHLVV